MHKQHHTTWGHIRDRIGGPVSSRSNLALSVMTGYQCGRSLHKNFQEDHLNSKIFRSCRHPAILHRKLIPYHLRILSLASIFYKNETIAEQQFT